MLTTKVFVQYCFGGVVIAEIQSRGNGLAKVFGKW